uniref:Uncharacterized protein n=1 Tax=Rhizophora mucronata TaxID=61149 RepID=A0A2P2PD27_RHIMU
MKFKRALMIPKEPHGNIVFMTITKVLVNRVRQASRLEATIVLRKMPSGHQHIR